MAIGKSTRTCAALTVLLAGSAHAAALYGSVTVDGGAPRAPQKIELVCADRVVVTSSLETGGSYRLLAPNGMSGCSLRIDGASAPVVLYDSPKRYDFALLHHPGQPTTLTQR